MKEDKISEALRTEAQHQAKSLRERFVMEDELKIIIDAIGLSRGHYYVIADCGGAMETSKCPDCQAVIGGSNHQLAPGNRHASELGGRPAWDPNGFDAQVARGDVDLRRIQ